MRLAKLTAQGFKSFGDKIEIDFNAPITGIVGPNGCGKSNVVDAIKWVLGSQSAKSLRGGAMMDVIFNGTSTRKPSGMAQVTLTFENKKEFVLEDALLKPLPDLDEMLDEERKTAEEEAEQDAELSGLVEDLDKKQAGENGETQSEPDSIGVTGEQANEINDSDVQAEADSEDQGLGDGPGDGLADDASVVQSGAESEVDSIAEMTQATKESEDDGEPKGVWRRRLPVDTDFVAVTRQLYRDGTSEYLINSRRVRLRDIKELFMDTGVGTEAYSIIEQGKVARMLEANPQQRREIFEEAAGISRFKARKKEAERKLDRIENNLQVTRTRLDEIQKRLRSVKMQAGRARTYKEIKVRLDELQLSYAMAEYHKLSSLIDTSRLALEELSEGHQASNEKLEVQEDSLTEIRSRKSQVIEQQKQKEQERLKAIGRRDQATQRGEYAKRTLSDLESQLERNQKHLAELAEKSETLAKEIEEAQQQKTGYEEGQVEAAKTVETAESDYRKMQHELNEKNNQLEDEKAGIMDLMRKANRLQNEIRSLESFQTNLTETREKLDTRAEQIARDLEELLSDRDEGREKLAEVSQLIEAENQKLESLKTESADLDQEQRDRSESLATAKEARASLDSRRKLLEEMEANQEGLSDPVKAILAEKEVAENDEGGDAIYQKVRGLLVEIFETDVDHAQLVETSLGDLQQALVVDDLKSFSVEAAQNDLFASLAGRLTFIGVNEYSQPDLSVTLPEGVNRVVDLVSFPGWAAPLAWGFLGRTLVVKDVNTAMALFESLPRAEGYRFVTETGELLEAQGELLAGPMTGAATGLISRRSELASLQTEIAELDETIEADTTSLTQLSDKAAHLADVSQKLRQSVFDANASRVELKSRVESLQSQIQKLENEQPGIASEVEHIYARLKEAQDKQKVHSEEAEQVEAASSQRQQNVDRLQAGIVELNVASEARREALTVARVEQTKLAEQLSSIARQIRQQEMAKTDVQRRHELTREQIQSHESRVEELKETHASSLEEIEKEVREIEVLDVALKEITAARSEVESQESEVSKAVDSIRSETQALDKQVHAAEVSLRELEIKRDGSCERALEQIELDLPRAYLWLTDEEEARKLDEIDWQKAEEARILALHQKMEAGELNLVSPPPEEGEDADGAAVDGFEDVEEGDDQAAEENREAKVEAKAGPEDDASGNEPEESDEESEAAKAPTLLAHGEHSLSIRAFVPKMPVTNDMLLDDTFEPESFEWKPIEKEIKELRTRISRLGNVNLDAIEEQDELENADEDITGQLKDIEEAREDLRTLIERINEDSKKRFEITFEEVKRNFAGKDGLFRKLFGGGKADVHLVPDENGKIDVLEAGIEVTAKPPGKEPQSIRLLSGGEKTMTSVALLLSIFKSKPSPFAILDEVDAALDEANVHRFAGILQSFLDHSHFIVITHRKGTMQAADILYGITMQERGVSKRVAVKFDQIGSGGHISEDAIKAQERMDQERAAKLAVDAANAEAPTEAEADGENEKKPEDGPASLETSSPETKVKKTESALKADKPIVEGIILPEQKALTQTSEEEAVKAMDTDRTLFEETERPQQTPAVETKEGSARARLAEMLGEQVHE